MKKIFKVLTIISLLMTFVTGCDNFLNSNNEFKNLMQTEIDYAKAPLVNVLVGHNNDEYGTVGTGVVNYSLTAKVGYAFEVSFALRATAGNFVGWNAYTKYDPDVPSNCELLDESYIEFLDNSQNKTTAIVKILKKMEEQIRLVPEVTAFPVMEVCLSSELIAVTPSAASFNPPQPVRALTPEQEYLITATTSVDYGFSENPEDCWKVYRKDSLGNEIEIADGDKITIIKNPGTQLANGRSQSIISVTVDPEFSGRFYVSPKLITYPSMKVEIENFDDSLIKLSDSGTVSMAKDTPYSITLETDPSIGFKGWRLCTKNNNTLEEISELFPADNKTTTDIKSFTTYSDKFIEVSSPTYDVTETGKSSGKIKASILVKLKEDIDDLEYSYYLLPQFFKYPVVNIKDPDGYGSAGHFSLTGAGYLENDTVRMMMNDYEYTITYKTTEDFSFADEQWIVYETSNPTKNLLNENDDRIEILQSSIITDESGSSSCSLSIILKYDFGTTLNIKPVVTRKPSMNISFAEGTPNGINLSLGGNTITSGSVNSKEIKMSTNKSYTATVNIPKGYSFEGWKLVREKSSSDKINWITESTKSTTDIAESASLEFDEASLSEKPADYIKLFNAKYDFQNEGRNAGTTKATIDISFKKELTQFSLNLIPVVKAVPEISFIAVNSDYGTLSPSSSDVRNLYSESKIDLTFKSTKQATAGKEIWKIKQWDSSTGAYSIDYNGKVGYTSQDLTAALKDPVLSEKEIIIYSNDNEADVQPNSKGEYITTKTAVLYVNKMPEANLQLSVTPEVYNTIKFVPGTKFESTTFDTETYIPAGVIFNFELKTMTGYKFDAIGTPTAGTNTLIEVTNETTDYNGVSTVTGTIKSTKNNGDTVVVTPAAAVINKVTFGKPALLTSANFATKEESAGTMVPASTDFIYQLEGNSTSIRFETTGEYTYEGFAAGSTQFIDVSDTTDNTALYVVSKETLSQAKAKAANAKLIIHDIVETDLTDSQGQSKKRITGTLTLVKPGNEVTIKPLVKSKPSFSVNIEPEKGSVSPSSPKAILIGEDYSISYISTSGYSFKGWSITSNGTAVKVLSLNEAKNTSDSLFAVDLGSVQELTGNNSLSSIQAALGTNKTKLLAVIYNTNKAESQATEGVETATARFRIVQYTDSTIVVSPVVMQKPCINISFAENTPNGINLSLGGNTITSGSVNSKEIKMSTGKTYTATVNVPKGYLFEGWRLVREKSSNEKINWITENAKSTTDITENAVLEFDNDSLSENPSDYINLYNAKYDFKLEGKNAGTTKATVDISFKKELSQFSLNIIPVIKAVPEISFADIDSASGTLSPSSSDVRYLYPETKIDLTFKSTKQATAGKEIWKIKQWDYAAGAYLIDYSNKSSGKVSYTSLDLTAALNDPVLKEKEIIIYSNDTEAEVQPNSKGEYITTKTAVLYVNKMPEANIELSVLPEIYNTIQIVSGEKFKTSEFADPVIIPAGRTFDFTIKTIAGFEFSKFNTKNGTNTTINIERKTTGYDGVTTVTGTIESKKNNGDTVVLTPSATAINKVTFGNPVLSASADFTFKAENAGTMVPASTDFIYQLEGNSTSIRFETTGEYTYEGFAAGSTKFIDVSETTDNTALYVLSTGTLSQAQAKASAAQIIIHDIVETDLTDSQGQSKKRITGTLTLEKTGTEVTVKPLVKGKPVFAVSIEAEKGSVSPSSPKAILIGEDYSISYISTSGYSFKGWSITSNGTAVKVLSLNEAKNTSDSLFAVDLGSVQELTGNNSLSSIQAALGTNKSKLLAVIYNTNKAESQATEGVETATARFRIVKDTNSTIIVNPIAVQKPGIIIAFENGTPDGISLSLNGNTITSGIQNSREIQISTGKTYTAAVNVPKGYLFEGWRLVRKNSSNETKNWITESTKSTTEISESNELEFDNASSSEKPADYICLNNAKYEFKSAGQNAETTKASVDIKFKKELSQFSLNIIPVIKTVPEISFETVNSEYGTLTPSSSDKRYLYPGTEINLGFKSTKKATAGKEIWKIKQQDSTFASVGYTSKDLTSALNDSTLNTKEIIILNNDKENDVQPNSQGEYITSKSAVLYVNKMPETNLQLSVTPEIYNTIKFVPGEYFESSEYDSAVIIPAGKIFNYTIKTKTGYKFSSIGTPENGTNTRIPEPNKKTDYNGVSTVTGTIESKKNNGDTVVVTPEATELKKVTFGKPSTSLYSTTEEDVGTTIPPAGDYIYQIEGNSISIKFETTGEYTYEVFAAGGTKFSDVSKTANDTASFVLSTGTLAQAKSNAKSARIIIHDIIETDLTDSLGQAKKRITGTLTVVTAGNNSIGVRPLVKEKPSFSVSIDAEKGSVSPAVQKAILINEDYDIRFVSTSGYGFEKWSVTNNGTAVPVLTLDEAKNDASGNPFVVNLDTVPELSGNYTLSNIQTALGTKKTNLFGILYNASKVESQATEGVETATAKFRIIQDVNSTIVVSPVTYKHSYFTLKLSNSAEGRFTPATRTMLKAGKDYDFEYVFNGNVFSIDDYSVTGSGGQQALTVSSISNWEDYSGNNFVIYGDKISVDENTGIVTRHGKIHLIKEVATGIEITITPKVSPHPKVSMTSTPDDVSKLQFNNIISTTGSIDLRNVIDHNLVHSKSYSISATAVNGKAIYADPAKMWKVSGTEAAYCTDGSYDDLISSYDIVLYNCRLESAGNNLYKACADIIVKMKQGNTYIIEPQVYTIPEFDFSSPVTTVGSNEKGTCKVNDADVQGKKKILVGQEYKFTYTAEKGNHISSFGLYENTNTEKKVFNETTESYTDSNINITDISFGPDKKSVSGTLTLLTPVSNYSFKCNVESGKPGPTLNIGDGKTHVTFKQIVYSYENSKQQNKEASSNVAIKETINFDYETAISRGYQGEFSADATSGYPIAKQDSIKFYINASANGGHTPSKVKITERLFYLHPGMIFDYSKSHDYSEFDVIGTDGLQLYYEDGNFKADSKYLNAGFDFETTTTYTLASSISYTNKVPYGGIHQYIVSVLDEEDNESNKFTVYLDVPRTPRTVAEENCITDSITNDANKNGIHEDGFEIKWPKITYDVGNSPLNENMRIIYSAGSLKSSTTECRKDLSGDSSISYKTCLPLFPNNEEFSYNIYISDSNGYATKAHTVGPYTFSSECIDGNLVVMDKESFKLYYIPVDLYLQKTEKLEPVAVVVSSEKNYGALTRRIIGAGLFDVGDYSFANSTVYYKQAQSYSFNGSMQLQTWKNNAPYFSNSSATKGDIPFTELYFPAIFKATHYGEIFKTKYAALTSGWYLPGVYEVYGIRNPTRLHRVNRALTAIHAQPFEYNSGYWSAEYAKEDGGGPRNIIFMTPMGEDATNEQSDDFAYSTEIHHVRAVFDFTDIAEPWPYN